MDDDDSGRHEPIILLFSSLEVYRVIPFVDGVVRTCVRGQSSAAIVREPMVRCGRDQRADAIRLTEFCRARLRGSDERLITYAHR